MKVEFENYMIVLFYSSGTFYTYSALPTKSVCDENSNLSPFDYYTTAVQTLYLSMGAIVGH